MQRKSDKIDPRTSNERVRINENRASCSLEKPGILRDFFFTQKNQGIVIEFYWNFFKRNFLKNSLFFFFALISQAVGNSQIGQIAKIIINIYIYLSIYIFNVLTLTKYTEYAIPIHIFFIVIVNDKKMKMLCM